MNKDLRPAPGDLDPIETASRDEIASLQLLRLRGLRKCPHERGTRRPQ